MPAGPHRHDEIGDRGRPRRPPVAGGVDQQPLRSVALDQVAGPLRRALRHRIERHAGPVAGVERRADRVLLDMIDHDPAAVERGEVGKHVEDHPRAAQLVGEVRRVDEDRLVVPHGQFDLLEEHGRLVPRVLIEPDLADAQHVGRREKLWDRRDHLAGELHVLGLLGVDAQPRIVGDPIAGGPPRLHLGDLPEVVTEAVGAPSVEAGPEGRLADGHATHPREGLVVVGDSRDHVDVGIDVVHGAPPSVRSIRAIRKAPAHRFAATPVHRRRRKVPARPRRGRALQPAALRPPRADASEYPHPDRPTPPPHAAPRGRTPPRVLRRGCEWPGIADRKERGS